MRIQGLSRRANLVSGRIRSRNSNGIAEISEFLPVLYVLFLLVLMPLLDVVNLFVAAAAQYLATNDIAAKSATQADYTSCLNNMVTEAYQFQATGLAKFIHLSPNGGYTGCGDDLFMLATNVSNGAITNSGADLPLNSAIDTTTNMYELQVKSVYDVSPLISLGAVPLLSEVPGLGKPVTLTFTANRPVEHPGGLQSTPGGGNGGQNNNAVVPFARLNAGNAPSATASTWRTPNIYQLIQQAGGTVVAENVVLVKGNNPNWTSADVTVSTGEKIWIDTQAIGIWNAWPGHDADLDANGMEGWSPQAPNATVPTLGQTVLAGQVGTTTPFFLGDDKFNYPPPGTGNFGMIMNDSYYQDNSGAQMVRVIVVR